MEGSKSKSKAKVLVYHGGVAVAKLSFDKSDIPPQFPGCKTSTEKFIRHVITESCRRTSVKDWYENDIALAAAKQGCRGTTTGDILAIHIGKTLTCVHVEQSADEGPRGESGEFALG